MPSFRDLQSEFMPVRDVNAQQARSLSRLEQLAVWITDRVGSMGFFLLIAAWTAIWLAWNTLAPPAMRFDPAPAFAVWLFVSNLLQLHLMPLIMVGQNLEERHDQLRAQADFEISLKGRGRDSGGPPAPREPERAHVRDPAADRAPGAERRPC